LARHIVTIAFFLLTNLYFQISSVSYIFDPMRTPSQSGCVFLPLKLILGLQGFFMPFTRLFEPFFYQIVAQKLKSIRCPCSSKNKDTQLEQADDETFLGREFPESDLKEEFLQSKDKI